MASAISIYKEVRLDLAIRNRSDVRKYRISSLTKKLQTPTKM